MSTHPQSLIIRPYANNYGLSNTTNKILAALNKSYTTTNLFVLTFFFMSTYQQSLIKGPYANNYELSNTIKNILVAAHLPILHHHQCPIHSALTNLTPPPKLLYFRAQVGFKVLDNSNRVALYMTFFLSFFYAIYLQNPCIGLKALDR